MFDADTVREIANMGKQVTQTAPITTPITLENGKSYTYSVVPTDSGRSLGTMIKPPPEPTLTVSTLTGFHDAIDAMELDTGSFIIHVEDHLSVSLKARYSDQWGTRQTVIMAKHVVNTAFRFDVYYDDPQKFIIHLQSSFLQTEELLKLLQLVSNLKAGNTVQTNDDGFSQTVTVKTGEVSAANVQIPPRMKLIPMRTFPEAAPVVSEFLLRFQQNDKAAPSIALYDVDGKKWQNELMQSIKKWLTEEVNGKRALGDAFPIVA